MMARRRFWAVLVGCGLLAGFTIALLVLDGFVRDRRFDGVQKGMTRAEVEALLRSPGLNAAVLLGAGAGYDPNKYSCWEGQQRWLLVEFDQNQVVTGIVFMPRRSLIARIADRWLMYDNFNWFFF